MRSGAWRYELTPWQWHIALHNKNAEQKMQIVLAKNETEMTRTLYNGPTSLRALIVWVATRLSNDAVAQLDEIKLLSWSRLLDFESQPFMDSDDDEVVLANKKKNCFNYSFASTYPEMASTCDWLQWCNRSISKEWHSDSSCRSHAII